MESLIRTDLLVFSREHFQALMPWIILLAGIVIQILALPIRGLRSPAVQLAISLATLGAATYSALPLSLGGTTVMAFGGMMSIDPLAQVFNVIFLLTGILTLTCGYQYLEKEELHYPEFYSLVLFSVFGMMTLSATLDLIVIFIALEIMSLSVYCLVGFRRADRRSNEAALKYFLLGGVASAVFLYGAALAYGGTGTLSLGEMLKWVSEGKGLNSVFILGAVLLLVGFLFKIASVPFHMWMPDVYEGSPTPITGFMTAGVKAASFAVLMRLAMGLGLSSEAGSVMRVFTDDLFWWSAVVTMVLGNLVALTQTNLKRMLAYSSIAHTGYLLIGILTATKTGAGYESTVFYLFSYAVMNLGAFAVLTVIARKMDVGLNLQDLAGLRSRSPWLAFSMAIFMFSMAGIPMTAGFIGKYFLFYSAIQAGFTSLVVIAVLCSVVSVYYYLRIIVFMYMRPGIEAAEEKASFGIGSAFGTLGLATLVVLTLQMGVVPQPFLAWVKDAIS